MISRAWVSPQSANSANTSIARRTLRNVAVRITIVVAIATVISYWHVRTGIERQTLESLERYVEQRRVRESAVFELASSNIETFATAYQQAIQQTDPRDAEQRFASLFETRDDGTTRLTRDAFNTHKVSGFIGKHVRIDRDLKRRLVVAFDLVSQFGAAWARNAPNLYVVSPEGAIIMFWPGQPWALEASDWEVFEQARPHFRREGRCRRFRDLGNAAAGAGPVVRPLLRLRRQRLGRLGDPPGHRAVEAHDFGRARHPAARPDRPRHSDGSQRRL